MLPAWLLGAFVFWLLTWKKQTRLMGAGDNVAWEGGRRRSKIDKIDADFLDEWARRYQTTAKGKGTWERVKESKCAVYKVVLYHLPWLSICPQEYQYNYLTGVCVFVCVCCFLLWPDRWQWAKTVVETGGTRGEMAEESPGTGQLHIFWVIFF